MASQDGFLDQLFIVSNETGAPNLLKVSPADVGGPDPSQSLTLCSNDLFSMDNAGVSLDSPSPSWDSGRSPGTPDMSTPLLGLYTFELTSDFNYPSKSTSYTSTPSSSLPMTPLMRHMNDFSLEETSNKEVDNLVLSITHDDPNDELLVFGGFAQRKSLSRTHSIHGSHMLQLTNVHSSSLDPGQDWNSSSVPPSSTDDAANASISTDVFTNLSSDNASISPTSDALFTELGREITHAESITRRRQGRESTPNSLFDQQPALSPTQPSCGASPCSSSPSVAVSHYGPAPSPSFTKPSMSLTCLDAAPSDISSSAAPGHRRRHSQAGMSPTSVSPRGRPRFRNYSASVSRRPNPYARPEELSCSRSTSPLPPLNCSRDLNPMLPQGGGVSPASGSTPWSSRNSSPMPSGSRNASLRPPSYSAKLQNGLSSEQMIVNEQVGSDAIRSASTSRRTREATFECEICSSTFTARHNLTITVGMPEMWACIRGARDQKPTRQEM
ncbi:hypothetical protein FISHEDRAFT_69915 [Fistulina hepatica ATCC 64428]|uniref:Uncharacterized protein n=1 Tax=Fistulina hepatica ATCC 64428 TaxID=1128425 RepID=A0A0D7AKU3_9AGAR|nr:hypothetical protein FISHEDRAFT_69915 [Fistulina hepatica ATCC 64428]